MPVTHEPWLVALSLVVAVQGAYVGLSLAAAVGEAAGVWRRWLLAAASISLAVAIWAMHFVGMLAARVPFPVDYLVFPTLLSFLVCVLVVGAAVFAASAGPPTPWRLGAAAAAMGCGIVSMHYIGMHALHTSARVTHAPAFVAGSFAVATAASGLALWLAGGRGGRPPLLLSATALGLAITGMHYTAMWGVAIVAHTAPPSRAPALSTDLLAIVVAIVAFLVSGAFFLLLVPDAAGGRVTGRIDRSVPSAARPAAGEGVSTAAARALSAEAAAAAPGPGGDRRAVRHLAVEREGGRQFVSVDDIVAVHANAHYTYIFDGHARLFCPLAIGEVESRLDPTRFLRVHRSHIVNLDRIAGLRRAGDTGVVELAGPDRHTVPVSRSRFGRLKSRIGPRMGEAVS